MPSSAQGVVRPHSNTPGLALTPALGQFLASGSPLHRPPPLFSCLQSPLELPPRPCPCLSRGVFHPHPPTLDTAQLIPPSLLLAPCPRANQPSLPQLWGRPWVPALWPLLLGVTGSPVLPRETGTKFSWGWGLLRTTLAPQRGAGSTNSTPSSLFSSLLFILKFLFISSLRNALLPFCTTACTPTLPPTLSPHS